MSLDSLSGKESVLDLTCGSGVFLVEALRRLVRLRTGGGVRRRATIRDTLYNQVFGVDASEAAMRIAAFSLYLAALELDPDPQPPEALRFEPLQGRTLLVGDAHTIEKTAAGREVLGQEGGLKRFDVIVGNPPWSHTGKAGTAARRAAGARTPLRGQSLDFVVRARDFAHDTIRFGMILSATPFFGRSATTRSAVLQIVDALAPVTLVNLSELSGWLFRKANLPAVAFLARHRGQCADRMTVVQAGWSPAGERNHTIEVGSGDVTTLPIASWKRNAGLLKAAFLGRRPDLLLLDELCEKHESLRARLAQMGVEFRAGLTFGTHSRDARFLKGLPLAEKDAVAPFSLVVDDLPAFDLEGAQWPRDRCVYRAPLVLVKEFLQGGPRPAVAVAERDVVFTAAYFGAAFGDWPADMAYLVAGILGSALASWYLLMTGSAFGLWMRRLLLADLCFIPVPNLKECVRSTGGKRIVQLARSLHRHQPIDDQWDELDQAVFDLYDLDEADRIALRDGLLRAGWQWKAGRESSVAPVAVNGLRDYADAFLSTMDAWLSASNRRRMRAEIYDLAENAPHRIVRFVLEDRPGPSVVKVLMPDGPLDSVLEQIGQRTEVQVTEALVGLRELRVHGSDEVSIIKPAARRYWLGVRGLEDADVVVRDSAISLVDRSEGGTDAIRERLPYYDSIFTKAQDFPDSA